MYFLVLNNAQGSKEQRLFSLPHIDQAEALRAFLQSHFISCKLLSRQEYEALPRWENEQTGGE